MTNHLWNRFKENLLALPDLGFRLDISRMRFPDNFIAEMQPLFQKALKQMESLESGEIVNPDENRMVGHYWLRSPSSAPDSKISNNISSTLSEIKNFAKNIHSGEITGEKNRTFTNVLIIGIGGSALGPQLVYDALYSKDNPMRLFFCDNTDPDGIAKIKGELEGELDKTLCLVISKSGGTKETRNGMLEFEHAYKEANLNFAEHAVAITCEDSGLDSYSKESSWLKQFYLWDWVGGRTSLFSAVGILPAALQGLSIDSLIEGARKMDSHTRNNSIKENPALLLSAMWYYATDGKGKKDMVVLPYKDRLLLFSKYLQQLVMESLGKEKDLDGNIVHQGISVYGNKGSTDQHAYVQQLREGVKNFFALFIEVQENLTSYSPYTSSPSVDEKITSGDYLHGFFLGTRSALYENDRDSTTITIEKLNEESLGSLIALFERAVGFYASYVNINAYHQPGVEAGKKAAENVISLQKKLLEFKTENPEGNTVEEIASELNEEDSIEAIFWLLEHMSQNSVSPVERKGSSNPENSRYKITPDNKSS